MTPPPLPATAAETPGGWVALVAAAAQVVAAFHRWHPDGTVALDVPLLSSEPMGLVSVGGALLLLAALPALAVVVTTAAWPRFVAAVGTGGLVLWWVALGPVGPVAGGVQLAAAAVCLHLLAGALAD